MTVCKQGSEMGNAARAACFIYIAGEARGQPLPTPGMQCPAGTRAQTSEV